jgi:flavin-binding protein dodecin
MTKSTQIAVARSSECGRGMWNGAIDRRSYRHDTLLALRGGKVAAYQTKLRVGFCGVYVDRE